MHDERRSRVCFEFTLVSRRRVIRDVMRGAHAAPNQSRSAFGWLAPSTDHRLVRDGGTLACNRRPVWLDGTANQLRRRQSVGQTVFTGRRLVGTQFLGDASNSSTGSLGYHRTLPDARNARIEGSEVGATSGIQPPFSTIGPTDSLPTACRLNLDASLVTNSRQLRSNEANHA